VSRLQYGPIGARSRGCNRPFRHQAVPGGVEDEFIAAAGFFEDCAARRAVRRGTCKSALRLLHKTPETVHGRVRQRDPVFR
jgi:hypothetical protein